MGEFPQVGIEQLERDADVLAVIRSMKLFLGVQPVTNRDNLDRVSGLYKMLATAKGSHSLFRGSSRLAGAIGQRAAYLLDEAVALKTTHPELAELCDNVIDATALTLKKYHGILFPKYQFRPFVHPPTRYSS